MSCHEQGSLTKGLPMFLHALTLPTSLNRAYCRSSQCLQNAWARLLAAELEHPLRAALASAEPAAFLHSPIYPLSFWGWRSDVAQREGRSSDLHHHPLCLLDCHRSWELLASCVQPCTNAIRRGCKLRISKGQERWIEFQSTWLMLFEVAGNFSHLSALVPSEIESHVFQKC